MAELSLVDVVNLKNNPSRESRLLIAEKICEQFNNRHLTDEESIIVTEIFRLLAKDVEVAIRQCLSEKLKYNSRLPEDIAFMLANDVMQVALPILQYSPVLSENDLIVIARSTKELAKLMAIAKRDIVTPAISHAVVLKGQLLATEALLNNKGASLHGDDLMKIIDMHSESESLMMAFVVREELPVAVAERLVSAVSGALRNAMALKHPEYFREISSAAGETQEEVTLTHVAAPANDEQRAELVNHLFQNKKLNSSILIRSICKGDIEFFVDGMAKLTGMPRARIERAVQERSKDSIARIYRAAGMPDSMQEATLIVLNFVLEEMRHCPPGTPSFAGRILERVVSGGYDRSVNNMSYLLTLIGKRPTADVLH